MIKKLKICMHAFWLIIQICLLTIFEEIQKKCNELKDKIKKSLNN